MESLDDQVSNRCWSNRSLKGRDLDIDIVSAYEQWWFCAVLCLSVVGKFKNFLAEKISLNLYSSMPSIPLQLRVSLVSSGVI